MSLSGTVRQLCERVLGDGELQAVHPEARAGIAKLAAPLVVAVAGQLSAGKSTTVNALVGRRVAETGAGETTEVNWWFRRGSPERMVVRRVGAPAETFPLARDGRPPRVEGLDADGLEPITVYLDDELLDEIVVVDSPGLFSPTENRSARAAELLARRTARAGAAADALLYLTSELPGARRDMLSLDAFHDPLSQLRKAPTNVLLLLSRADELWSPREEGGPLELAGDVLARHRDELRLRVWDATPLIGLLAEAARVEGALDEQMASDVRRLAAHLHAQDAARRPRLLRRATLGAGELGDVPLERRRRLLERLGAYGLLRALELVDEGAEGPGDLRAGLLAASGWDAVIALVRSTFRERGELIRADAVLAGLERRALAAPRGTPPHAAVRLRAWIEAVRLSAAAEPLRRLRALRLALDPEVHVPAGTREELRRLLGDGAPAARLGMASDAPVAALAAVARERRRYWRAIAAGVVASPERRAVADAAATACEHLARDVSRSAPAAEGVAAPR